MSPDTQQFDRRIQIREQINFKAAEEYKHGEIVLHSDAIQIRVEELAKEIAQDYEDSAKEDPLLLVGVMEGGNPFMMSLAKELYNRGVNTEVRTVKASSYHKNESGDVNIGRGFGTEVGEVDVRGRNVLIIDDIADTRRSLNALENEAIENGANSIRKAVMLNKPENKKTEVNLDYVGFDDLPNVWVIGYGLNYSEGKLGVIERLDRNIRAFTRFPEPSEPNDLPIAA